MNHLIERLAALEEDVRYQEPAHDGEPEVRHVPGPTPVLLSAPHGAVHTRLGKPKEEDEYTAGLARLVAELTGAHALYARRRSNTDPNWYRGVPYKACLRRAVQEGQVRFVLDLHAAAPSRDFGIALGTIQGQSCPQHRQGIIDLLERSGFRRDGGGLDRLDVDQAFTARGLRGQETVTCYAWETLGVPAAQLEFHPCLRVVERRPDATSPRPYRGDPQRIAGAVRALVDLIRSGCLL